MKIILDSNIYISAFLSKGLASNILIHCEQGDLEIFTSEEILNEVKTRLTNKLRLDEEYVKNYVNHIRQVVKIVKPKENLRIVKQDPDDNKILECAVEADANLIVSIDKHLLKLKKFRKTGIVHPKTLTWIIPKFLE